MQIYQIITITISIFSFLISAATFLIGKYIATKITGNDLKHITADIEELKNNEKEYKVNLREDLNKIFKRLGTIDKQLARREALCEERHSKDR